MSSHHFVKEKQEPALVVGNGAPLTTDHLTHLLEWNPYIVALDGGIHYLLEKGIKVDMLIGDFDSIQGVDIDHNPLISNYLHIQNQEYTDLEKGIEHLIKEGHHAANLINITGKRLDHTLNNIHSLISFSNQIKLVLHDNNSKAFILQHQFKKHLTKSRKVSLIPLDTCENIQTKGLKYNLNQETLQPGFRSGSSNEVEESGIVEITYSKGNLLWVESND
jgi:thiamine pyrophosphokinase